MKKIIVYFLIIFSILAHLISCSSSFENKSANQENSEINSDATALVDKSLRSEMQNAQNNMRELFYYIWSPSSLSVKDLDTLKTIVADLSNNFHTIEDLNDPKSREVGFDLILENQMLLLTEAKKNLSLGNNDFALWQLKGVSHNCFYCHTRLPAYRDLSTQAVVIDATSFESRIAEAEYLVATRQFSLANDKLLSMAKAFSSYDAGGSFVLKALKLWLLSNLRVRDDFNQIIVDLRHFSSKEVLLSPETKIVLEKWVSALESIIVQKELEAQKGIQLSNNGSYYLDAAKKLLAPHKSFPIEQVNEENLVNTIYATSILHRMSTLESSQQPIKYTRSEKQELLYLLGTAYSRITIPSLQAQSDTYFKHCISLVPKTTQSRLCFKSYQRSFELGHTGSSGLHYQPEEIEELNAYRKKAGIRK